MPSGSPPQLPDVSIVMPAYNAERTIAAAITSVLAQSFRNWELIVVDDGSLDATALLVREAARTDGRIVLINACKNSGRPSIPRNAALKRARGQYIAFLDADDVWHADKLQRQLAFMSEMGCPFSCTGFGVIDEDNRQVGGLIPPSIARYQDLLRSNTIGCLTVMYDTRIIGVRQFPDCGHEDYALWLEILREGNTAMGLQEPLALYRLGRSRISSKKLHLFPFFWHIYRIREGFSTLISLLLCVRYAAFNFRKYKHAAGKIMKSSYKPVVKQRDDLGCLY